MRNALSALLLAAPIVIAAPAMAGPTITVTDVSVQGDAVTITGPISPDATIAGPITLTTTTMGQIIAWCVDIYHSVFTGGGQSLSYQLGAVTTNSAPSPTALSSSQLHQIAQLAQYGQSLIGTASATDDNLAAVQLAIWSVEYPTFTYTGASGASIATAELNAASLAGIDAGLIALGGTQTFVTASPSAVAAVPEPAALAMLLSGLVAVGVVVRRRSRA